MDGKTPINKLLGPDFNKDNTQMEGATLGDILDRASKLKQHIVHDLDAMDAQTLVPPEHDPIIELGIETPKVDRMLNSFDVQWRTTVDALRLRAEQLHKAADDLEHRANTLEEYRTYLTDVKNATLFEIESRMRADSLQFVKG